MNLWTQIWTVPGMGGAFVLSLVTLWMIFLGSLVAWIARAPRDES